MAGFVDGNKGDVSSGCTVPTDGSHCPRDFPGRFDPPSEGGSLGVFLVENAGEILNPSRLTQGITRSIYYNLSRQKRELANLQILPVSPAYTKSLIPSLTKSVRRPAE